MNLRRPDNPEIKIQNHILETSRLRLRAFHGDDAGFVLRLLNTPAWLKFVGDKNVKSEDDAVSYLENGPLKSYRDNGFGLYLVETKSSQTRIGMCGILRRPELESPDIGFAFLPEYTGQGYALEAATATLRFAIEALGISRILAITRPENNRSTKILLALGFAFEKIILWPGGEPLELYSVTGKPNEGMN